MIVPHARRVAGSPATSVATSAMPHRSSGGPRTPVWPAPARVRRRHAPNEPSGTPRRRTGPRRACRLRVFDRCSPFLARTAERSPARRRRTGRSRRSGALSGPRTTFSSAEKGT